LSYRKFISWPALYYLAIAGVLVVFFELWRLLLLWRQSDLASAVPGAVLTKAFWVGLRFDLVIACYLAAPLYVAGIIPFLEITRRAAVRRLSFGVLVIVVGVIFLAHLIDLEFFPFFNSRLNGMALTWRDTPGMMLSMVWEMFPVIRYLLLFAVVLAAFVWVARQLQRRLLEGRRPSPIWINLVYLPAVLVILVIGARGRIEQKSPIRTGMAYFSEYDFANQLALNPAFTFWRDAIYDARDKDNLEQMMASIDCPDGPGVVQQLLGIPDSAGGERICRHVRFMPPNDDPPNVILVIMESFGNTKLDVLDNRFPFRLSPGFDSLAEEGVLFTNFYSAGRHTYTGVFSSLLGCPHQFTELVMKMVPGQTRFKSLASILRDHGYRTCFFLTHDPHFDNLQGFVMANGVMKTYSALDYDPELRISTWGVPDHVMFDRTVAELRDHQQEPFFAMLLTTSFHGPWIVPDMPFERVPPGVEREDELNAFKYSDWALRRFVRMLQSDPAFANTLIFITADNGSPFRPMLDLDLTEFAIPLLILDTDRRLPAGKRLDRLGGQLDIPATVMGLVRLDYDDYSFGRNLLDSVTGVTDFAHFSAWFKIGYIEDNYYLIHRLRGGPRTLYRVDDCRVNLADSLPELAREYEKKALAIFKTGYHNVKRPLPLESAFRDPEL